MGKPTTAIFEVYPEAGGKKSLRNPAAYTILHGVTSEKQIIFSVAETYNDISKNIISFFQI